MTSTQILYIFFILYISFGIGIYIKNITVYKAKQGYIVAFIYPYLFLSLLVWFTQDDIHKSNLGFFKKLIKICKDVKFIVKYSNVSIGLLLNRLAKLKQVSLVSEYKNVYYSSLIAICD
jgi:hypothetical protein